MVHCEIVSIFAHTKFMLLFDPHVKMAGIKKVEKKEYRKELEKDES